MDQFFEQVHILASGYHWSERDILSMPRKRRNMYVQMLERDREKK